MFSPPNALRAAVLAALVSTCLTGCVMTLQPGVPASPPPAYAEVVVQQPPPPPREEIVVQAPSPAHVWIAGHWDWRGRWVWVPGHWAARPHHHAAWTPGYWQPSGHGWVWVPGYWR